MQGSGKTPDAASRVQPHSPQVQARHFELAMKEVRPSVGAADRRMYEAMRDKLQTARARPSPQASTVQPCLQACLTMRDELQTAPVGPHVSPCGVCLRADCMDQAAATGEKPAGSVCSHVCFEAMRDELQSALP